ncbi:MAG: translocation/assembly module TamB domain-containing protein [Myxococcota bacterium]
MSDPSQAELDLLADGREVLERWCASPRYRYLYPEGPNLAVLLEAYQQLDRRRLLGRIRDRPRTLRRALRRLVRQQARGDALARSRRLRWRYPPPRVRPPHVRPMLVELALGRVDLDARDLVEARIEGQWAPPDPSTTLHTEAIREQRGLDQFRDALINEALARPAQLSRLHPQFLLFAASPAPRIRRYPIASFLLVKLPLRVVVGVLLLLTSLYVGAYAFFNDERLGTFVSDNVSGLLEGELRMERIHWELPLFFDLVTGRPTHVEVEHASVWEPYESYGGQRKRRTAFFRRMEADLTLHEIIPWNRLGVPEAIEIPWALHLSNVRSEEEAWVVVREYDDTTDQGQTNTLLSLLDAFTPLESDPERRGLSFWIDDVHLTRITLDVDFMHGLEGWRTEHDLRDMNLALRFDAPTVQEGSPPTLPLRFAVGGRVQQGYFALNDIEVPLSDFTLEHLACGMGSAPLVDVAFAGRGLAAGSPLVLEGSLQHAFSRELIPNKEPLPADAVAPRGESARVHLTAGSTEPAALARHIEGELGLARGTIVAPPGAELWAWVEGPLREPRYRLAAEGLSLDLMGEPAWAIDDVQLSVDVRTGPVPDRWRHHHRGARRLIARFDSFEGAALDGDVRLDLEARTPAHVVFPEGDEPFLIAAPLWVDGVNPAQLTPDDVEPTLAGQATGRLDLHRLELGPPLPEPRPAAAPSGTPTPAQTPPAPATTKTAPAQSPAPTSESPAPTAESTTPTAESKEDEIILRRAELHLDTMRVTRDHGPQVDGLPRRVRADGTVTIGADGAIDVDGLVLRTDGTELSATGGVDGALTQIDPTQLRLQIDDGKAFARAFALPPYFSTLDAQMSVFGSTRAPSGHEGRLNVAGVGVQGGKDTDVRMSMNKGALRLEAPRAHLFGGDGSVDAELTLFSGGRVLSDPPLRATIELEGVELSSVVDVGLSGPADLQLSIGDAQGRALPLSRLEVRGQARVPELRFGGTRYRDARVRFSVEPEQITIDELVLPVHRAVSPFHDTSVTVPIGRIVARGTIGLQDDPSLDLEVEAQGVPLRLVARLLEVDVPLRGRIGDGTQLTVQGSVRRPSAAGTVQLQDLSAEGVVLGTGPLEVTSQDLPAEGPLAAHRELRVTGELTAPGRAQGGLQWTVDAVVALGETSRARRRTSGMPAVDAEVDVRFNRIALDTLLAGLLRGTEDTVPITGQLDELSAHVLTCDPASAMLTDCLDEQRTERSLEVSLQMGEAWVGGHEPTTTNPCQDPTILCAPEEYTDDTGRTRDNQLRASIDWPMVTLDRPWRWTTGGPTPAQLVLSGNLDLSTPTASNTPPDPERTGCEPPPLEELMTTPVAPGAARAEVHGSLDMAVIAELLGSSTLGRARGRLDVDLALQGPATAAVLSGRITLPEPGAQGRAPGLSLDVGDLGFPVEVDDLDLRIDEHWLAAHGQLRVLGDSLRFGTVGRDHTGFAFGGPCEGHWGLAAEGTAGSRIINALAGEGTATKGGVELPRVVAQGRVDGADPLDRVDGTLRFGRTALTLDLDEGLPGVELTAGRLDFSRCGAGRCPPDIADGSIALYVGGKTGASSEGRPGEALRAKVGPRGTAFAWGTAYLAEDLGSVDGTRVVLQLDDVPYRDYDQRGRPIYEAELSSSAVTLEGGIPLVVAGQVGIDRARYVLDAVQGVEILRFTDDVDLPSAPPPDIVRNLQFDLQVQTQSPLRVDNNIAHGVEADAVIDVTGSYDAPEFTGRVDVEPGGTVDIPFLTGTYEIQRGRVTLLRELADAEVDVLALRKELVYIDEQPRQVYLMLGGTASAITWQCIAEGDTSGAVETQSGCLDYLVLGAGDVQSSALTVQRSGGGGLANARKPLSVVGHVTEFDFGRRIEQTVPRLGPYVPDMRLRLGQIGPELEVATPQEWLDFDYAHGTLALDYTRGYPGFLLQQSRELTFKLEAIDLLIFEVSRDIRSYLNNRIIFDPLRQTTIEFRVDFEIPSLR